MFDKILLYIVTAVTVALLAYSSVAYIRLGTQETKIHNLKIELDIAKTDIKLKSFEAKHKEKKESANEDINNTLSNTSDVSDGNYSL